MRIFVDKSSQYHHGSAALQAIRCTFAGQSFVVDVSLSAPLLSSNTVFLKSSGYSLLSASFPQPLSPTSHHVSQTLIAICVKHGDTSSYQPHFSPLHRTLQILDKSRPCLLGRPPKWRAPTLLHFIRHLPIPTYTAISVVCL